MSSLTASVIDTFLFFSISFYGSGIDWVNLAFGDLLVKMLVALLMLVPFRILLTRVQQVSTAEKNFSV